MVLKKYTTQEVAAKTGYHLQSVYNQYAQTGSFLGVKPRKLLNGRLLWSANDIDALLTQDTEQEA